MSDLIIKPSGTSANFKVQNPSGTDKIVMNSSGVMTTLPPGMVIEQFCSPCDGSAITVQSGTYTVQNVTTLQNNSGTWEDLTGSTITYTPPTGTQTVIYEFSYQLSYEDTQASANSKLLLDDVEVVYARASYSGWGTTYNEKGRVYFKWGFHIGGSADANSGRVASWTSGKTIKLQVRSYSTSFEYRFHEMQYWEGSAVDDAAAFTMPLIGITAIS